VVNYNSSVLHGREDAKPQSLESIPWLPEVTWRHRTQRGHFPTGGQWWPCIYLAPLRKYKASKTSGSRPWLFGVTWRHRSGDQWTHCGHFPIGVMDDHASILHCYGGIKPQSCI